jgi:hypothetical protein
MGQSAGTLPGAAPASSSSACTPALTKQGGQTVQLARQVVATVMAAGYLVCFWQL